MRLAKNPVTALRRWVCFPSREVTARRRYPTGPVRSATEGRYVRSWRERTATAAARGAAASIPAAARLVTAAQHAGLDEQHHVDSARRRTGRPVLRGRAEPDHRPD